MPDIDPPLVDLKVSNPITYLKKWWAKVIGNEGIDFRLHFHPLTAIAVALAIASVGFGVGRFVFPFSVPFFKYEEIPSPTESVSDTKDTAYVGTLHYSSITGKFYLTTTAAEAITLIVPQTIDLSSLIGKRILAAGSYDKQKRTLIVSDAKDLEVLPKSPTPIPTSIPTPLLTPTPTPTPTPQPS